MFLDDSVGDRQAETGTLADFLGREERIVDSRDVFGADSRSRVLDPDEKLGIARVGTDPEGSSPRHGVLGVQEQVQENLLQLTGVAEGQWGLG